MCIAIPMKVVQINGNEVLCEYKGVRKTVRGDLVSELKVGDYVIIHAGFIIQKVDIKDAIETIRLYEEIENL